MFIRFITLCIGYLYVYILLILINVSWEILKWLFVKIIQSIFNILPDISGGGVEVCSCTSMWNTSAIVYTNYIHNHDIMTYIYIYNSHNP